MTIFAADNTDIDECIALKYTLLRVFREPRKPAFVVSYRQTPLIA
jgi:hypothetical protein